MKPRLSLRITLFLAVAALFLFTAGAMAQTAPGEQIGPGVQVPPKPHYPRLDSSLNHLVTQLQESPVPSGAYQGLIHAGPSVAVTVYVSGNLASTVAMLQANGAVLANTGADYLEAYGVSSDELIEHITQCTSFPLR